MIVALKRLKINPKHKEKVCSPAKLEVSLAKISLAKATRS